MNKIKSLYKKSQNLDLEAFKEGLHNFALQDKEIEKKAAERAAICATCPSNVKEPIKEFKIKDSIASISEKSCFECGCILPYLVRQNKKGCKLGKWS